MTVTADVNGAEAPTEQPRPGYEVVARTLAERDVTHVFAMLGAGCAPWIGYAEQHSLFAYVGVRHEAAAVSAAAGFARASGQVGVCCVNCGPGLANAVGALTAAVRDRAPVVVLVSEVPTDSTRNQAQVIDQVALVAPTGAAARRVPDAASLPAAIIEALESAERDQWPQVVTFDERQLDASVRGGAASPAPRPAPVPPDPAAVRAAADLVMAAHAPLVLAGRGVLLSSCADQVAALAADCGALLTTSLPAHHLFPDEPYAIGFTGGWAMPRTRRLADDSDLVLAVGASLNSYTTHGGTAFPNATIVQCDRDPAAIGCHRPVELGVVADAQLFVEALRAELARRTGIPRTGRRTADLAGALAEPWYHQRDDRSGADGLDLRAVLARLDEILPPDRVVVSDVGRWSALLPASLPVGDPRSLVLTLGFASIGHGLGAALGAAHACPDRPVVLVAGDGGFLMAAQELGAVHRAGLDLTVVVIDDEQFGAEVPALERVGLPATAASFPGPDYVQLAHAYSGDGVVVRSSDDLAGLTFETLCPGGLMIVDAKVDPRIDPRQFLRD